MSTTITIVVITVAIAIYRFVSFNTTVVITVFYCC